MGWAVINKDLVKKLLINDLPVSVINELLNNKVLLINSNKRARISCVSDELFSVFNIIKSRGIQPLFIGLSVCDTDNLTRARLNLRFASIASGYDVNKVFINKKAEQLFLYSRDVWSESIIRVDGNIIKQKLVFVFNNNNTFIGLAFAMTDKLLGKGRRVVLKNIIDLGYYLRCERQ